MIPFLVYILAQVKMMDMSSTYSTLRYFSTCHHTFQSSIIFVSVLLSLLSSLYFYNPSTSSWETTTSPPFFAQMPLGGGFGASPFFSSNAQSMYHVLLIFFLIYSFLRRHAFLQHPSHCQNILTLFTRKRKLFYNGQNKTKHMTKDVLPHLIKFLT